MFLLCFSRGFNNVCEAIIRVSGLAAHLYTEPTFEVAPGGTYWRYQRRFEGTVLGPTQSVSDDWLAPPWRWRKLPWESTVAIFGDSITLDKAWQTISLLPPA